MPGKSIVEKIWDAHVIRELEDGRTLLAIDRHIIHDGTSQEAFNGLRARGRRVKNLAQTFAALDHGISTMPGRDGDTWPPTIQRVTALRTNCAEFGVTLFDLGDADQGIVHVVAPEQGIALPGTTLVCGDSHTATNGGLGTLAWGIGTSEVMHVLAAQALIQHRPKRMRVTLDGSIGAGVYAKDVILHLIGRLGVTAGKGYAVEYAGPVVRALGIEGRMTICNMSIELGSRMGIIAPDDTTFEYIAGRPHAPKGALWDQAVAAWRQLPSDEDAAYDLDLAIDCGKLDPQVTWGTSPSESVGVGERVPDPSNVADAGQRQTMARSLDYMGLAPGDRLDQVPIDVAFIGSCTNARLSDLQAAAEIARGRHVADGVKALVVPGSTRVKAEAEALGLDRIFTDAGFEWRESGCSMCVGQGGDALAEGQRSISTTNRNFENRQGRGGRTHLASPAMVAAAAIAGHITDVRKL